MRPSEGVLGGRSIQLARVFGVRIGVDPSWFLILFLVIWSLSGTFRDSFPQNGTLAFALATVSALLFFLSVVLHELGHAWVAIRNGIRIAGIDLWLFGGMARMSRDTDSPGLEFRVAAAGPLVTLVITLLCVGGVLGLSGADGLASFGASGQDGVGAVPAVLSYLAFVNAALLVFNLIPGFPLDGGRIARAIAWKVTGDRTRATRFAGALGRAVALLLACVGVWVALRFSLFSGVWLVLIALFLGQAARAAVTQTRLTAPLEGLLAADVMDDEPVTVPAGASLERALDEFFLRYGWPWFPVVDGAGRLLGVLSLEAVEAVPEGERAGRTAADAAEPRADAQVSLHEPVEGLLAFEGLRALGALMAVDGEGRLRGVITLHQLRRVLRPSPSR